MTNLTVINALRKQIKEYDLKISELLIHKKRVEDSLSVYLGKSELKKDTSETKQKSKPVKRKQPKVDPTPVLKDKPALKLYHKMDGVLGKLDVPLTSNELLNLINDTYHKDGGKLTKDSFGPQLSLIYRDPSRGFKRIEFPENPSETKFFYGLKKWFDQESLKDEYFEKLAKRHRIHAKATLFQ